MPYRRAKNKNVMQACLAGGLIVFALTAVAVQTGVLKDLDPRVLNLLRDPGDPSDPWGPAWFEETVADITALGGYPVLIIAAVFAFFALVVSGKAKMAMFMALALTGGSLASSGLKLLFDRPRPDIVGHLDRTFTSSFPSAHAMVAMVYWLTLAAIAARFTDNARLRSFIAASALIVVLMIGLSRIYLGVHWPSDILAGWSIGLAWAAGCWLVAHWLSRQDRSTSDYGKSD